MHIFFPLPNFISTYLFLKKNLTEIKRASNIHVCAGADSGALRADEHILEVELDVGLDTHGEPKWRLK